MTLPPTLRTARGDAFVAQVVLPTLSSAGDLRLFRIPHLSRLARRPPALEENGAKDGIKFAFFLLYSSTPDLASEQLRV
jgi:hypothetical protein